MNKPTKIILLLIISIQLSQAYLDVYIPQCAKDLLPQEIEFTLPNFGFIPYGQTLIGQLVIPQNESNSELCSIEGQKPIKVQNQKAFLLVKRGTCNFTEKVLNAQKLGSHMVVVYSNEQSQDPDLYMANDGRGHLIQIPSVYISKKSGQTLLKAIQTCGSSVVLRQTFDVFESEIVSIQYWLNLGNRESYILLRDLNKNNYFPAIQERIDTSVRFQVNYGCEGLYCDKQDCIGSAANEYCLPIPRHSQKSQQSKELVSGSQILKESLRMYFLFDLLPKEKTNLWYQYMNFFDKNICFNEKDTEACSYEAMQQSGVNSEAIQGVKSMVQHTFALINSNEYNTENVFNKMKQESDFKDIIFSPQVIINDKNCYGLFRANEVFEMICSSLLNQPKQCVQFMRNQEFSNAIKEEEKNVWLTVLGIVLMMTLGFVVALYVHSRVVNKEVDQKMSLQVNKLVQNYVSLVETKRGKSCNKKIQREETQHDQSSLQSVNA